MKMRQHIYFFEPDPFCVNRFDSPNLIFTRPFRIEFVEKEKKVKNENQARELVLTK